MFMVNPLFSLRRSANRIHKERRDKAMEASKWINVASQIQQSIQEVLAKHGVKRPE
jgi:hypothetical protein